MILVASTASADDYPSRTPRAVALVAAAYVPASAVSATVAGGKAWAFGAPASESPYVPSSLICRVVVSATATLDVATVEPWTRVEATFGVADRSWLGAPGIDVGPTIRLDDGALGLAATGTIAIGPIAVRLSGWVFGRDTGDRGLSFGLGYDFGNRSP